MGETHKRETMPNADEPQQTFSNEIKTHYTEDTKWKSELSFVFKSVHSGFSPLF